MELAEREEYITNRETELEEKGDMLKQLEAQVISASTAQKTLHDERRSENADNKGKKSDPTHSPNNNKKYFFS